MLFSSPNNELCSGGVKPPSREVQLRDLLFMKRHRDYNIVNASIYMHFVNDLSSKASSRSTITNVDVTELSTAALYIKIKRISVNN